MNSREYRKYGQWRHRRRAAWITANRKGSHPETIEFARKWAPFGGASLVPQIDISRTADAESDNYLVGLNFVVDVSWR
jgi:hypothetical protein